MPKLTIGLTGPSSFTAECIEMVEEFFGADLIMLYHNDPANLARWVRQCHAVILAGGVDIHPSLYNESIWNNCNYGKFDIKRDEREVHILNILRDTGKPHLGICRGHQLIGVTQGMFLIPDVSTGSVCHQPKMQSITCEKREPMHSVDLIDVKAYYRDFDGKEPKERHWFRKIMQDSNPPKKLWVNSFHHQAVAYSKKFDYSAAGITVYGTARCDAHKIPEIIELMGGKDWLSCQWHPEFDWRENTSSRAVLKRFKQMIEKPTAA